MYEKQNKATAKTLATGMFVGGLALTTLAVTGCDKPSEAQVAALTLESATQPVDPLTIAAKLAANHNETFLVCAGV